MRRLGEGLTDGIEGALLPFDSRALEFDVKHEIRRTVVELLRQAEPTTILGVVLANPDGVEIRDLADTLDIPVAVAGWRVEHLEDEELVIGCKEDDGAVNILPFAPYTAKNEVSPANTELVRPG
jgi:hypothetical protein